MRKNIFNRFIMLSMVFAGSLLLWSSCVKEKEFSEDYDVPWPVPVISEFSPKVADISTDFVITGSSLEKVKTVTVGGTTCVITEQTDSKLTVTLPRVVTSGKIELTNVYKKSAISEEALAITYPNTSVTGFPEVIYVDYPFIITGENMDLVTSLTLGDTTFTFDGSTATETELTVATKGAGLEVETQITNIKCLAGNDIQNSEMIPVEVKEILPPGSEPFFMLDFEDAVDRYTFWDGSPVHGEEEYGINLSGIEAYAPSGGSYYQTVKMDPVPESADWAYFGEVAYGDKSGDAGFTRIDLSQFRDPHISLLINSGSGVARIMFEVYESEKFANHVDAINTNGEWQWVSIPIGPGTDFQNWGANGWDGDDNDGVLDYSIIRYIQIGMGTGDVGAGNRWEINMDNFQITDGPVSSPNNDTETLYTFFDFEDGNDPFVHGDWQSMVTSTSAINGGGLAAPQGSNYLQVSAEVVEEGWNWWGNLEMYDLTIDLTEVGTPYISFWVNNEGREVTFEAEVGDYNGGKWGTNWSIPAYDGWQIYTLNVNTAAWGNWGADTDEPDFSGLTHIKLGFNSNNQPVGPYDLFVDNLILTDGPYFQK
ncbi:IPT/TIG domain-containing protein [Lentimicrobium sp. S6]|uniref:IPT/TIG domain-containing protein n=1 Tax=Lentimicrobium sp. S6 TaxID=2735872 RepID=UPI00155362DA|nr:IPT/TIG domain-containing protein [Lentimicrobium sp. S6]NPD45732.1 IPT/TIG domain-containing protein [Lentimicrobium sp. S6]